VFRCWMLLLLLDKTYKGVMYSRTFSISLIALTMITTLMILAVTSNVVLSLGMVGALSIGHCISFLVNSSWYSIGSRAHTFGCVRFTLQSLYFGGKLRR